MKPQIYFTDFADPFKKLKHRHPRNRQNALLVGGRMLCAAGEEYVNVTRCYNQQPHSNMFVGLLFTG